MPKVDKILRSEIINIINNMDTKELIKVIFDLIPLKVLQEYFH